MRWAGTMPPRSRGSRRAAVSFLVLAAVATACPADEPQPRPERASPLRTLRVAYPDEPATLNPVTEPSPAARDLLRPLLPSFYRITPDLRYEPSLLAAEPEVVSAEGRTEVRFRIREDAVWSDGTPVTVDDVAFTWRVWTEVEGWNPTGFDRLLDVVADEPKAGRLVLDGPWPGWRDLFSAGRFVLPSHVGDPASVAGWNQGPPVTAGPYRLERWVPGRSVVLVADPNHWGGRPAVDRLEVLFVPDPTTALQLLDRGELDVVTPMAGISWGRRLAEVAGGGTSRATGPDVVCLALNAGSVGDVDLRRRIANAVDRARFLEVALRDEAEPADGVLVPEQVGAEAAWVGYGTGPPTGEPVTEELELVHQRTELPDLVARYIQAELERAAVDAELVALEPDVLFGSFLPARRFDLAVVEVRTGPSPELWRWVEVPGGGQSLTGLEDRGLVDVARQATDGSEEALRETQVRLADVAAVLPLYRPRVTIGWRDGIRGPVANATVEGPLWNVETWAAS
jgi:peptide/nickel transport system substrate-binding protein